MVLTREDSDSEFVFDALIASTEGLDVANIDSFQNNFTDHNTVSYGWTPLNRAAQKGNLQFTLKLISAGADLDILNTTGYSPVMTAIKEGHTHVAQALILLVFIHVSLLFKIN